MGTIFDRLEDNPDPLNPLGGTVFDRLAPNPTLPLQAVEGTNPDDVAKSRQLGLPPDSDKETIKEVERERLVQGLPSRTSTWLSNPENAAIAHDSLEELSTIENLAAGIGERGATLAGGFLRSVGTALGSPQVNAWAEAFESVDLDYRPATTWEEFKQDPLWKFLPYALETGIVSLPDMVAVMTPFMTGAYVVARAGEMGQQRAQLDLREDATVGDIITALPGSIASMLLERIGTAGILGVGEAAVKGGFTEIAKAGGRGAAKEALTEALQSPVEELSVAAGTETGTDIPSLAEGALAGAVAGAGFGGTVRTVTASAEAIVNKLTDAQQAKQDEEALLELRDSYVGSKLFQRDPEAAGEHLGEVLRTEKMYVSGPELADWIRQSADPQELASQLGITDELAEGEAIGTDVEIDKSLFAKYVLASDRYAELSPHVKLSAEGMTPFEADQYAAMGLQEDIDEISVIDLIEENQYVSGDPDTEGQTAYEFSITQNNNIIAGVTVADSGKDLRVLNIDRDMGQDVGPSVLRKALRVLQQKFPNAEYITGFRISGARDENTEVRIKLPSKKAATVEELNEPRLYTEERDLGLNALFRSAQEAGMTENEWVKYQEAQAKATDATAQALQDQELARQQREATTQWKAEKETVETEVRESLGNEDVYRAFQGIQRERLDKAAVEAIAKEQGFTLDHLPKDGKRAIYAKDGLDPQAYAELYGYDSAQEMLLDFITATPFEEAVRIETDRRMNQRHGDLKSQINQIINARKSLHNDETFSRLSMELDALARSANMTRGLSSRILKKGAEMRLSQIKVKDLTPTKYLQAEKRWGREAGRALRKKDFQAAARAKFNQLINYQLVREAYKAENRVEKQSRYLSKFLRNRKAHREMAPNYLKAIRTLLDMTRYSAILQPDVEQLKLTDLPDVDLKAARKTFTKNYRNLTLQDFTTLHNTVKEIHTKGLAHNKLRRQTEKRNLDIIVAVINDSIKKNLKPKKGEEERNLWDRFVTGIDELNTLLFYTDTVLGDIDGAPVGTAYSYIKGAYDRAMSEGYQPGQKGFIRRDQKEAKNLVKLFKTFSKKDRLNFKKLRNIPGLPKPITTEKLIMVLLNSSSNREVLKAEGWTESQIAAVEQTATEKEWDFVNATWDYLETFFPEVREAGVRRENVEPEKVEGRYFPIVYNKKDLTFSTDQQVFFDEVRFGLAARSQTAHGHRMARQNPQGYKLRYDLSVIHDHINRVIYDLEMGDAVNDIYKVIHAPEFKKALTDVGHGHKWEQLDLWLRDIVQGERGTGEVTAQILRSLRRGVTISSLGWNFGVTMVQYLGLLQTAVALGKLNVARGALMFMRHPLQSRQFINNLSPFMASRGVTFHKDILDAQKAFKPTWFDKVTPGKTADWIRESLFYTIRMAQGPIDTITWLAAHRKGMETFKGDVQQAIRYADQQVRTSQASGIFGDRTAIERGSTWRGSQQQEWVRSFTAFISYFLARHNVVRNRIKRTNWKNPAAWLNLATDMALIFIVEAFIYSALKGQLPDDEDDYVSWTAGQAAAGVLSMYPVAREFVGYTQGFDVGGVIGRTVAEAGQVFTQVKQGDIDAALAKSVNRLGGILGKYPASQINKTGEAILSEDEQSFMEFLLGPQRE